MQASRRILPGLLLGLLLLPATGPAQAEIYRWTDSQGVVHYTQTPPPAGSYDTVKPAPPPADPAGAARDAAALERQLQEAETRREVEAREAQRQTQEKQRRRQNCDAARTQLEFLQQRPSYRSGVPDGQGEYRRTTPGEHAERIARAQKDIASYCDE